MTEQDEGLLIPEDIVPYLKAKYPHLYRGNDEGWCRMRESALLLLLKNYDTELLLDAQQAHTLKRFKKALEQSRKGEPLDLSEEEFELFSAIQNDGVTKNNQKIEDIVIREGDLIEIGGVSNYGKTTKAMNFIEMWEEADRADAGVDSIPEEEYSDYVGGCLIAMSDEFKKPNPTKGGSLMIEEVKKILNSEPVKMYPSIEDAKRAILQRNEELAKQICQLIEEAKREERERIRALFLKYLTVDSKTQDARRKEFNQAIFIDPKDKIFGGRQVFNGTDLDMVMEKFDKALKEK